MITKLLLTALLLLLPVSGWAAIDCNDPNKVEFNDATPTDPETIPYTTPSGTNQVLLVGVALREAVDAIGTPTHAGNAMTAVAAEVVLSPVRTQLFYIVNPTAGTNNVVLDHNGTTPLADAIVIWTCSGVNTASPVHDPTPASSTGTAVTVTVPNLVAGDVVIDMFGADVQTAGPTIGANQTEIHSGNDGVELGWGASYQAAADGGVMSWTLNSSEEWVIQAVALTPAVSGAARRRAF